MGLGDGALRRGDAGGPVTQPLMPPGAPAAQLRFKVLATRPAETSITVQATSSEGSVNAPESHTIGIVARRP